MLLTRYELKLCYHSGEDTEIYQGGLFRGRYNLRAIRYNYNTDLLDEAIKMFVRKSNHELHAPRQSEFLNENIPSENALFYFTENGQKEFEQVFSKLSNEIENNRILYEDKETILFSEVELVKIEIDLSKVKKYTCCYQDDYQMCIEF